MVSARTHVSRDLESLLGLIAIQVQLPPSLDEKARDRYETLTKVLQRSELGGHQIFVYAQGSYRIGTTVKPLTGEDFDLDFVVEVLLPGVRPAALIEALWTVLASNETYRGMIERRPSCIRILYADGFHVDLVPAIPDPAVGGTAILIPRQEGKDRLYWHGTNPRGYADWFTALAPKVMLQKSMAVEPLPPPLPAYGKTPQQASTQLFKRNHQVRVDDEHLRTPSIVLTTLVGYTTTNAQSLGEAMDDLVGDLSAYVELSSAPTITNPAAEYEVISEKWSDDRVFRVFQAHAKKLCGDWEELLRLQGTSATALTNKLSEMFDSAPVERAVKVMTEARQSARDRGQLSVGVGGALVTGATARANPRHTYFGD